MSLRCARITDQSAVITHHEAGHVVAALMTVDNPLNDELAVTVALVDGRGTGNSDGLISSDDPVQAAFIFYAGPWAEARVQRGKPVDGLDEIDENGLSFRLLVSEVFRFGPGSDGAYYAELTQADPGISNREPYWSSQLENVWSVIEKLADELRDRLNDAEPRPYLPELGDNRAMKSASMPNREVLELVKPLLEAREMWRYLS